jgi:hypothetical protein
VSIIEAVRRAERIERSRPLANVELRRACWVDGALVRVGSESFYTARSRAHLLEPYSLCPSDVLAGDWEVIEVASDPEAA